MFISSLSTDVVLSLTLSLSFFFFWVVRLFLSFFLVVSCYIGVSVVVNWEWTVQLLLLVKMGKI